MEELSDTDSFILRPVSLQAKFVKMPPTGDFSVLERPALMTVTIHMDCFEIAFRKSQLATVFRFFGAVEKFKKRISKY